MPWAVLAGRQSRSAGSPTSRWVVCFRFAMWVSAVSFGGGELGDEAHLLDGRLRVAYRPQFEHGGDLSELFPICSRSGWAKRGRMIRATMSCYPFGITAWTSRFKCPRQRCQPAPWNTVPMLFFRPV